MGENKKERYKKNIYTWNSWQKFMMQSYNNNKFWAPRHWDWAPASPVRMFLCVCVSVVWNRGHIELHFQYFNGKFNWFLFVNSFSSIHEFDNVCMYIQPSCDWFWLYIVERRLLRIFIQFNNPHLVTTIKTENEYN